ncbi:MAG: polysaccharide biosynthesis/export family protein [Pyrinomonadaceae bacterium]|nr:polysaccharide biosynthesis/export family protein [Pyrinomonadaceae bacterium]
MRFIQAQEEAKTRPVQTAQASTPAPKIEEPERVKAYVISTGDTLNITIARRPELNWRGQINSDGDIPVLLYLEKPVRALCRTEMEVAKEIAEAYTKLIRNPEVTVRVIERSTRPVIMFGAVRTPQRFQLQRDVRLNELLFITGGVTDRASGDIQIFTPEPVTCLPAPDANTDQAEASAPNPIKVIRMLDLMAGKEETNPLIRPGDIVTVMVAEPVYLTGGVVSPQGINFREQLTLTRAIATVGGLSEGARAGEIRIYRRMSKVTEQEIIKADYNAIKKQQQPDIPLKAYDIIEVPRSSGSQARRSWHSAAQEIVADEKQSAALPLRILN